MKLLSCNLAGRLRHIPQQIEMLASRTPDLVVLQEVTQPGLLLLRTLLAKGGLIHQADNFEWALCPALLTGPRRYGLLIASRFPIVPWELGRFNVPWPERMLSVDIETPWGSVEVHTTHIPPGVTNGWIKIEMLEGLYRGLAHPSATSRILCGDFNTPQLELPTGEVVTWGQCINRKGVAVICQHMRGGEGVCWDRGERHVLQWLVTFTLEDGDRWLDSYATQADRWYPGRQDRLHQARLMGHRFDHGSVMPCLQPGYRDAPGNSRAARKRHDMSLG